MAQKKGISSFKGAALKLFQKRQYDKVLEQYKKALEEKPDDLNARLRLADAYLKAGLKNEAVDEYMKVADFYGNDGFYLRAIAVYKKVLSIHPDEIDLYVKLAELYKKQGLLNEAFGQLSIVKSHYEKNKMTEETVDILRKMAALNPSDIDIQGELIKYCHKMGLKDQAMEEYRKVFDILMKEGKLDDIIALSEEILKLDPHNPMINKELGKLQFHQKGSKETLSGLIALSRFKKVLEADPRDKEALNYLGQIYFDLMQIENAEATSLRLHLLEANHLENLERLVKIYNSKNDAKNQSKFVEKLKQIYTRENVPPEKQIFGKLAKEKKKPELEGGDKTVKMNAQALERGFDLGPEKKLTIEDELEEDEILFAETHNNGVAGDEVVDLESIAEIAGDKELLGDLEGEEEGGLEESDNLNNLDEFFSDIGKDKKTGEQKGAAPPERWDDEGINLDIKEIESLEFETVSESLPEEPAPMKVVEEEPLAAAESVEEEVPAEEEAFPEPAAEEPAAEEDVAILEALEELEEDIPEELNEAELPEELEPLAAETVEESEAPEPELGAGDEIELPPDLLADLEKEKPPTQAETAEDIDLDEIQSLIADAEAEVAGGNESPQEELPDIDLEDLAAEFKDQASDLETPRDSGTKAEEISLEEIEASVNEDFAAEKDLAAEEELDLSQLDMEEDILFDEVNVTTKFSAEEVNRKLAEQQAAKSETPIDEVSDEELDAEINSLIAEIDSQTPIEKDAVETVETISEEDLDFEDFDMQDVDVTEGAPAAEPLAEAPQEKPARVAAAQPEPEAADEGLSLDALFQGGAESGEMSSGEARSSFDLAGELSGAFSFGEGDGEVEMITGDGDHGVEFDTSTSDYRYGLKDAIHEVGKIVENEDLPWKDDSVTHFNLGRAYMEAELYDDAITEFQKASADPLKEADARMMIGICYFTTRQYDTALNELVRVSRLKGLSVEKIIQIQYYMGRSFEEKGEKDMALKCYKEVFRFDTNFEDISERLQNLS